MKKWYNKILKCAIEGFFENQRGRSGPERRWRTLESTKKLERWLLILGAVLLLGAAAFTLYQQWLDIRAGQYSAQLLAQRETPTVSPQKPPPGPAREEVRRPELEPPAPEFVPEPEPEPQPLPEGVLAVLSIPKLELELPVWGEYSVSQLKKTVCRYGRERCAGDQLAIAGHNYRSHFGGLDRLREGDGVRLTFDEGVRDYAVTSVEQIGGTDVDGFFSGQWDLSLFTCDATGGQRIVVRCARQQYE